MNQNSTLIMKFGGASVETLKHFSEVASIIHSRLHLYKAIVVVVSAMRGTTDQLISYAHTVNPKPPSREYDMLITVGERISCSLLAMALEAKGIAALSFTGSQAGIITTDEHTEAKIIDVRPHRLIPHLEMRKVLVVAGFQGVSKSGSITSLGRGGSDTTAVALGIALGAERVEFYKDVPGIYTNDPKKDSSALHLPSLDYGEAIDLIDRTGKVLHKRCLFLAEINQIPLHICSFYNWKDKSGSFTVIQGKRSRPALPEYENSEGLHATI